MKVLVIADTHAQDDAFLEVLSREQPFDALLHAGDFEGSEFVYRELTDVPFYYVAGNNDFFTDAPNEQVVTLMGCRIFMTHGHMRDADFGYDKIVAEARRRRAKIAIFGHTHIPVAQIQGGVLLLNPGSLSWPRQENHRFSYMVLTLENGRASSWAIRYL